MADLFRAGRESTMKDNMFPNVPKNNNIGGIYLSSKMAIIKLGGICRFGAVVFSWPEPFSTSVNKVPIFPSYPVADPCNS